MPEEKKAKTHIAIILDRSGSMSHTKAQTVMGYNEQVEQIQQDSKDQEILVSLVTFNGNVYEHFWNENAEKLTKASDVDYKPVGSTALYDAMGYVIDKLQKTTTEDDNTAYLLIVITDGEENASKQYTDVAGLKKRIESLQKDKNWTFTYMGCSKDSLFRLAASTGMSLSNCALWDNSAAEAALGGMRESADKLGQYMNARRKGERKSMSYHSAYADVCAPADYSCARIKSADNYPALSNPHIPGDVVAGNATGGQHTNCNRAMSFAANQNVAVSAQSGVFGITNKEVDLKKFYIQV